MPRRQFTGGAGGRKGYSGGFGTGGITPVDFLGVVPDQAAMLLLVGDKGDWCIRSDTNTVFVVINTPSSVIGNWQELAYPVSPYKVKATTSDSVPNVLNQKIYAGEGNLFIYTNPLGDEKIFVQSMYLPVISIFDNTLALPVAPADGDRYIALVGANGWTKNHIYQYYATSAVWLDISPQDGSCLYNRNMREFIAYNLGANVWSNVVDKRIGVLPIITIFDNTLALPVLPGTGDRYIAKVTAHGWTIDNIYEWNGSIWVETVAVDSMFVFNNFQGTYYMYGAGVWSNFLLLAPGDHLVKASAGDGSPGELDQKVDNSTIQVNVGDKLEVKALGITDAKVAVANKDGTAATPSMRTLGNGALQACAGNDARLSDARTPTAHASSHNLGGSDIITTIPRYLFYADQFLTPNNADWAVNAGAGASADSLNNSLLNRQFDDTTEEGVGFFIEIPASAVNMTFYFRSRAQTAPGAATTVLPRLYRRQIVDNTVIGAWSAAFAFAQIDIPTNARFQYDSETVTLATLGLTAGNVVQFELTRNPADGLTGDWNLLELRVYFG